MSNQKISIRMKFDGVWRKPKVQIFPIGTGAPMDYDLTPNGIYWSGRELDWQTDLPVALEAVTQWQIRETVDVRGWKFWAANPKLTVRELDGVSFGPDPGAEVDVPLD